MRRHTFAGIVAAACILASLASACRKDDATDTRAAASPTCSTSQAIRTANFYGTSLPPKTLALTFDDGPGIRTGELSTYLKGEGIAAAFFVNGKMLASGTATLGKLVADGHLVANHTQTHTSLTGRSTGGAPLEPAAVLSEVAQTDALIAPFVTAGRFLCRAPDGDFDATTYAALEATPMAKYVGPINWDIGDHMGPAQATDWDCWTPGSDGLVLTPAECASLYMTEIETVGRGVVLLHDPYFMNDDPAQGGTVDMVKMIVPQLKALGYSFARVDAVPEIAALLPPPMTTDAGADAASDGSSSDGSTSPAPTTPGTSAPPAPPVTSPADDPCTR